MYTLFTNVFTQIFPDIKYEDEEKQDIVNEILNLLPLKITYKTNKDIITKVKVVV